MLKPFRAMIAPLLCTVISLSAGSSVHAEQWAPIIPEELKMISEPKAPGAAAIYLERQIDRDDAESEEYVYERIKILTEEGRKYGDIEIQYAKGSDSIHDIRARTIKPDGAIVKFDGTVYDKTIVKGKGISYQAKTFTLPDVQVGSIIEYYYRRYLPEGYVFDSRWILSQELFTKHAKFTLKRNEFFSMRMSWPVGLPDGTNPPTESGGKFRLETHDVPAFVTEDYMPPENQLKYRVDFIYHDQALTESDPTKFWIEYDKLLYDKLNDFVDKHRAMEQAVAQIVQPSDVAEVKLRKLYARVQQLRNTSYEQQKTEQEEKRAKEKDASDVADVWKHGYGNGEQLTWLFLALARAAGFQADPVMVSTRDEYFFEPRVMNPYQLTTNVVVVNLDGKDLYMDPGTQFAPFGLLPWHESGVTGLRIDKKGGAWVKVPMPSSDRSRTVRTATLKFTPEGSLEGVVTITYTGLEALWRRLEQRYEDATERKEFLENETKASIPTGIDISLTNSPDWDGAETPLVAEYKLIVPGWAARAGKRQILPIGLFSNSEKHTLEHATRVHPLYFHFHYEDEDDISIELPAGWQISNLPQAHNSDLKVVSYASSAESTGSQLHIKRELAVKLIYLDAKYYSQIRDFFQEVRAADEEQIIVSPITSTPAASAKH